MPAVAATKTEIIYRCKRCGQRWYLWIYPPKQGSTSASSH